jgi:hypothetical protein
MRAYNPCLSDFSGPQFAVLPESLAAGMRTGKTSKIERIKHVLEGRKDAGERWQHEGHRGGLTNQEKLRRKNFMMVRKGKRAVANKIRKSNSDVRYDKMKHVCHSAVALELLSHLFAAERAVRQGQAKATQNVTLPFFYLIAC